MKKILKRSLLICVLLLIIGLNLLTSTIATYTKTLEPIIGYINLNFFKEPIIDDDIVIEE